MTITKDFKKFYPEHYLAEQYKDVQTESKFILRFLHDAYEHFNRTNLRILEVGGGPTLYQLLSASKYAKEIIFTDFIQKNLDEAEAWARKKASAFDWGEYAKLVALMEHEKAPTKIEKRLRAVLKEFAISDIMDKGKPITGTFDVVSSHFCPDSITSDRTEFLRAMKAITSFVDPHGMLVMSMFKGTSMYEVGTSKFPVFSIDEAEIKKILKRFGFKVFEIQTIEVEERGENNAIMCLWARR